MTENLSAPRIFLAAFALLVGCGGGSAAGPAATVAQASPSAQPTLPPKGSCRSTAAREAGIARGAQPHTVAGLNVPAGLQIEAIASVSSPRELAFLPNGDLLIGTTGGSIVILPNADGSGAAGVPQTFADLGDAPAAGVAFDKRSCAVVVGGNSRVWRIPYSSGDHRASSSTAIATVREPGQSGDDDHQTTSVAVAGDVVYAGVGSTCNACAEPYPLRATIQEMQLSGSGIHTRAKRFRNAIALTVNPQTQNVWAGGAGQDDLPIYHPYEFIDDLSAHAGVADYGWPDCEENHRAYVTGAHCAQTVEPRVELPGYSTIIGAAFYPVHPQGRYMLPGSYAGGLFVTAHGSWHGPSQGLKGYVPPRVVFVSMNGDQPAKAVNWSDPSEQWTQFVWGFQIDDRTGARRGRPTGVAVGPQGDLFVADDDTGEIYRIRPKEER